MKTSLASILLVLLATPAAAQEDAPAELPAAAVLETQASASVPEGTAGTVDRMVRARLDGLNVVRTSSGVSLDLSEVQLALGCVGETAECLAPVANELSVQLLVIPSLDSSDGELLLTITLFDREAGTLQRVLREASGPNARATLLDAIDGQLRELFELPPAPEEAPPPPPGDELNPYPFVVMGAGAATIVIGGVLGGLFLDAQGDYDARRPTTREEVDAANAVFSQAESYAIAADVLFGIGAAVVAAGLVWMIIDLTDGGSAEPSTTFAPFVGPGLAGLAIDGRWEGL